MGMLGRVMTYLARTLATTHVNLALARASATIQLRGAIDPTDPDTWEFVGFSQNGEDGIIDVLTSRILDPNRYFIEIGSDTGVENNTAWPAVAKKYAGLMVEGNSLSSRRAKAVLTPLNPAVEHLCMFVSAESVGDLKTAALHLNPDLFSLDIDGIDYHLAKLLLGAGFRPRVAVVEYNSAFGPDRAVTVPYRDDFRKEQMHPSHLYYGASVGAFRRLFEGQHGYRFVTVERNGVNAVFADPGAFDPAFLGAVRGTPFRENVYQMRGAKAGWEGQLAVIKGLPLVEV